MGNNHPNIKMSRLIYPFKQKISYLFHILFKKQQEIDILCFWNSRMFYQDSTGKTINVVFYFLNFGQNPNTINKKDEEASWLTLDKFVKLNRS